MNCTTFRIFSIKLNRLQKKSFNWLAAVLDRSGPIVASVDVPNVV